MFLCVSLNPAVDKRLHVERLRVGAVNRVLQVLPAPGGKAAHVAMVLKTLGAEPVWLGFAGGSTGDELADGLRALSIRVHAVATTAFTRTNLEIVDEGGQVTEILEPGASVAPEDLVVFQSEYARLLNESREPVSVILSGSLPAGLPVEIYKSLVETGHQSRARVYLDGSGEPFDRALAAKPGFVKPNREEAEAWSGQAIDSPASAENVLAAMLRAGAAAGAISLGADGLVWLSSGERAILARVPQIAIRSTVGSGDSALAGFAFAGQSGMSPTESLRLAAACGSANCFADAPGRARAEDIAELQKQIIVEALK